MAQSISFQEAAALAKSGDADAQYALSSVLHQRGQFDESLHWLRLNFRVSGGFLIPHRVFSICGRCGFENG